MPICLTGPFCPAFSYIKINSLASVSHDLNSFVYNTSYNTFDLEGQAHILFLVVVYVGLQVKTLLLTNLSIFIFVRNQLLSLIPITS